MWSNQYIGIPYKAGGRDRSGIDCWGLARLIYQEQYKINLPSFSTEYTDNDTERMAELIAQYREGWAKVEQVKEGDLVLFRVLGSESHIGIAISDKMFIHVRENSDTCVEKFESPQWHKRIVGFFRYETNNSALLNALPHPLKTERVTLPIPPGTSVRQLVDWISKEYKVSEELQPRIVILLNTVPVLPEQWDSISIKASDVIEYRVVPGKGAVRTLAFIALVIVAPEIAAMAEFEAMPYMASTFASSAVYATAYAATIIAGSALIDAIAPVRLPEISDPTDPGQAERMYMLDGAQNTARLYEPIPVILGKVKMTPPLGANNFTQYLTEREQYLSGVLVWGYGPLSIDTSTLKIGDALWSSLSDTQIVHLNRIDETYTAANKSSFDAIYGSDVEQIYKNITLTAGSFQTTPPAPEVDYTGDNVITTIFDTIASNKTTVTINFPQGLRRVAKKGDAAGTSYGISSVKFKIEVSLNGGTTWGYGTTNIVTSSAGANAAVVGTPGMFVIGSDTPKKDAFSISLTITNAITTTGIVGIRITRMTSSTKETDDNYYYYETILQSVQKVINTEPTVDPIGVTVAKSAFQIKASNQLSGRLEGINAIVQTYARIWNGTDWNTKAATNNPAALFLYTLTHPGNPQKITTSEESTRIDWTQLQYWYNYCVTKGFQFNTVVGAKQSLLEVLRDICAAGRASPALTNGKWTINIDEPKSIIAQHFSPHNSWGFEATKVLPKMPDGVKAKFFDEDNDYQENEVTVYNNGKTYQTSTLFESITLPGITKKSLVIDHLKWHLSQAKVRPEVYVLNTDIEYLVCTRGDRVKVTHFVPMWGIGSGRIKNRITSKVFDLDEPVSIDDTSVSYMIRVRGKTNTSTTANLVKSWQVTNYQKVNNIVTLTLNTTQHPFTVGSKITTSVIYNGLGGGNLTNISATNVTVTAVTATTVSYEKTGTNVISATAGSSSTATIVAADYSRIEVDTTITQTNADAGDLFLFGLNNTESQDLIVLSIEPTTNKSARLTLVDYGVTSKYNLFTDYASIIDTSSITYSAYSIGSDAQGTYVTLTINGGIVPSIGDKITVPDRSTAVGLDSTLTITNTTVTATTSTTITYRKSGLTTTASTINLGQYYGTVTLVGGVTFDSNITALPYNYRNSLTTQTPSINNITSDESVLDVVGPGSFIVKMVVTVAPAANNRQLPLNVQHVEVQCDLAMASIGAGAKNVTAAIVDGRIEVPNVLEGQSYKVKVRYKAIDGTVGPWSSEQLHTVIGKTSLPSSVSGFVAAASQTNGIILSWTANTERDLFGYEIRLSNSGWGDTNYVWKGQATQLPIPIGSNLYNAARTYYIKAIDYNGNYSSTATSLAVLLTPPNIVTNLGYVYASSLTNSNVTISWTAATVPTGGMPVKNYKVEVIKPAGATTTISPIYTDTTSVTIAADWLGDAIVKITTNDLLNISSTTYAQLSISKSVPNIVTNVTAQVIDNNILLYWTLPTRTSLPISHIKITKGSTYASSTVVGTKSGEFTSLFESSAGTYTYWLVAVDTDNRESTPVSITKQISQPPDYVLNLDSTSTFTGTKVNAAIITENEATSLLMLVNATETWAQHFTINSKTTIQNFIDAGNTYFVTPATGISSATYTETIDLGSVLAASSITITLVKENLIGSATVSTTISTSIDNVTWSTPISAQQIYTTDFRYVRVVITAQETASTDLVLIKSLSIKLDSRLRNDAGNISALASDTYGTIANFTSGITFADITSITVTPSGTTPLIAIYDFKDTTLNGTYTISGATITVNVTGHGLLTGQRVRLYFTSGSGVTGVYPITKINDDSYTITNSVIGVAGGNVSTYPQSMRIYVYDNQGTRQNCQQVSWSIKGY